MLWLALVLAVGLGMAALAYAIWSKWIRPWGDIEAIVRQIAGDERPRTFILEGARQPVRVGLALEDLFLRQTDLARQIAHRESSAGTIFSSMADGLVVIDARRRVLLANDAFRQMFHLAPIPRGEPLLEVIRLPGVDPLIEQTLRTDQFSQSEITLSNPPRQVEVSGVPMKNQSGLVILFRDVTELRRADRIRSDFVANVSHELRTPLSILRGYIETLLDDPETSPDEMRRILQVMDRHSKRLGLIANDLLTLARLESPTPDLQLSDVALDNLLRNVTHDWQERFGEKNLKATLDIASGLPSVRADETRLHEVLYNLLDNAVKYSREGDEIRLCARTIDGAVALSVSDSGPGISPEDLPRIFERFYRGDKARSRELGGTGLGLSIVKHIAQLHGGRVEAKSELGKGTTIEVMLPADNSKRAEPA